jgi:hypothetical protein
MDDPSVTSPAASPKPLQSNPMPVTAPPGVVAIEIRATKKPKR